MNILFVTKMSSELVDYSAYKFNRKKKENNNPNKHVKKKFVSDESHQIGRLLNLLKYIDGRKEGKFVILNRIEMQIMNKYTKVSEYYDSNNNKLKISKDCLLFLLLAMENNSLLMNEYLKKFNSMRINYSIMIQWIKICKYYKWKLTPDMSIKSQISLLKFI